MGACDSKTIVQNDSTSRNTVLDDMYKRDYASQEEIDQRRREVEEKEAREIRLEEEMYDKLVVEKLRLAFKNRKTCQTFTIDTDIPNSGSNPTKLALRRLCATDSRISAEWIREEDYTTFTVCFKA